RRESRAHLQGRYRIRPGEADRFRARHRRASLGRRIEKEERCRSFAWVVALSPDSALELHSAVAAVELGGGDDGADAVGEVVVLVADALGEPVAEGLEEGFLAVHGLRPFRRVDAQQL